MVISCLVFNPKTSFLVPRYITKSDIGDTSILDLDTSRSKVRDVETSAFIASCYSYGPTRFSTAFAT